MYLDEPVAELTLELSESHAHPEDLPVTRVYLRVITEHRDVKNPVRIERASLSIGYDHHFFPVPQFFPFLQTRIFIHYKHYITIYKKSQQQGHKKSGQFSVRFD